MIDYVVTMHGFDHVHKFKCHEIDTDDTKHDEQKKKDKQTASEGQKIALIVIIALLVLIQVSAIVSAAHGRGKSMSYDADITISVISPLLYWILRLCGKLGPATVKHH